MKYVHVYIKVFLSTIYIVNVRAFLSVLFELRDAKVCFQYLHTAYAHTSLRTPSIYLEPFFSVCRFPRIRIWCVRSP